MNRNRHFFPASLLLLMLLASPASQAVDWRVLPCADIPCPWAAQSPRTLPLLARPPIYPPYWQWQKSPPQTRGFEIVAPSIGTGTGEIAPEGENRTAVLIASQEMEGSMSAAALNPLDDQLPGALRGTLFTLDLGFRYVF